MREREGTDMKMLDLLEEDKDRFINDLNASHDQKHAEDVLVDELDKILYRYNEACDSELGREAASCMIHSAGALSSLTGCVTDAKIWETKAKDGSSGSSATFIVFLVIAVICAFASLLSSGTEIKITSWSVLFAAAALVLMYLSGRMRGKSRVGAKKEFRTELIVDAEKVYNSLHTTVMTMDQDLELLISKEAAEKKKKTAEQGRQLLTVEETDMIAGLLEAAYSGDGEFALDKLGQVPYFLHKNGIDVIDYSDENREFFDVMPSHEKGTIRPAILSEGRLLKKGVAGGGN